MAAQELDAAEPPPGAKAKQMLDAIHGRWWNVYIGGRYATRIWSPSHVREYVQHGIGRFMLTYVGEQYGGEWHGTLTRERGLHDGREALQQARRFGYSGGVPLCLDIERPTFETRRAGMIEYARAWCEAVRAGGARPGIYANPEPLVAMEHGGVHADFVWIAAWVTRHPAPHDPHGAIRRMPANLWSRPGQRAWQYAGAQNGTACTVLGVDVDISVSDLACLAPPPGAVAAGPNGGAVAARRPALRKGDHGPVVVRLTHRLSTVRSPGTGRPYLDGSRRRFDATTEAALKAFQHEHGLPANGTYGRASARALLAAAKRGSGQRHGAPSPRPTARADRGRPATAPPVRGTDSQAPTLPQLVEQFQRLDAEAERAWQRIEAYGRRSRRLLTRAEAERQDGLPGIAASLRGIEHHLADLVDAEERELALAEYPPPPPAPAASAAGTTADTADLPAASATAPPVSPAPQLADLPTAQLETRIHALDEDLDRSRRERIARYARAEKRL